MSELVYSLRSYNSSKDPALRSGCFSHSPLWGQLHEESSALENACRLLALEQTLLRARRPVPAEHLLGELFLDVELSPEERFDSCADVGECCLRARLVTLPFTDFASLMLSVDDLPPLYHAREVCEEYLAMIAHGEAYAFPYHKLDADFGNWPAVRIVRQ